MSARLDAQAKQLAAFLSKSGEQRWATLAELRSILSFTTDGPPRALQDGRAACNCCGDMVSLVYDRNGMQFCVPCVTEACLPPGEA